MPFLTDRKKKTVTESLALILSYLFSFLDLVFLFLLSFHRDLMS